MRGPEKGVRQRRSGPAEEFYLPRTIASLHMHTTVSVPMTPPTNQPPKLVGRGEDAAPLPPVTRLSSLQAICKESRKQGWVGTSSPETPYERSRPRTLRPLNDAVPGPLILHQPFV